jgi:D-alanyl-D-alanine carboxypeptidase
MKSLLHKIVMFCCCISIVGVSTPAVLADNSSSAVSGSTTSAVGSEPTIQAQTAIVIDVDTSQILYQKDMHRQMYPASITKIMTGLLAAESGHSDDVVTVSKNVGNSQGGSVSCIGLEPGEQITQDSLMYTMFLASANDSAYELAEHIGGTVDNFVSMMNERAQELGATDTHFANPNGLPDKNNYTSAYDMAFITRQAVYTPEEMKYFGAVRQTVPADNVMKACQYGTIVSMLRPDSMYYYQGILAAKSGWIVMSGFTLVTVAKRGDRTLICVQLNGDSWDSVYKGSTALFNYGFAQPEPPKNESAANALSASLSGNNKNHSNGKTVINKNVNKFNPVLTVIAIIAGSISCIVLIALMCLKFINKRKRRIARARRKLKVTIPYNSKESSID